MQAQEEPCTKRGLLKQACNSQGIVIATHHTLPAKCGRGTKFPLAHHKSLRPTPPG